MAEWTEFYEWRDWQFEEPTTLPHTSDPGESFVGIYVRVYGPGTIEKVRYSLTMEAASAIPPGTCTRALVLYQEGFANITEDYGEYLGNSIFVPDTEYTLAVPVDLTTVDDYVDIVLQLLPQDSLFPAVTFENATLEVYGDIEGPATMGWVPIKDMPPEYAYVEQLRHDVTWEGSVLVATSLPTEETFSNPIARFLFDEDDYTNAPTPREARVRFTVQEYNCPSPGSGKPYNPAVFELRLNGDSLAEDEPNQALPFPSVTWGTDPCTSFNPPDATFNIYPAYGNSTMALEYVPVRYNDLPPPDGTGAQINGNESFRILVEMWGEVTPTGCFWTDFVGTAEACTD